MSSKTPLVVKKSNKELFLGVIGGLVLMGAIIFGFLNMSRDVAGKGITGKITAKHFTPHAPETQITVGKGGLQQREVDGEYRFEVFVEDENKTYTVWVDKKVYEAQKEGDLFFFLRPTPKR